MQISQQVWTGFVCLVLLCRLLLSRRCRVYQHISLLTYREAERKTHPCHDLRSSFAIALSSCRRHACATSRATKLKHRQGETTTCAMHTSEHFILSPRPLHGIRAHTCSTSPGRGSLTTSSTGSIGSPSSFSTGSGAASSLS